MYILQELHVRGLSFRRYAVSHVLKNQLSIMHKQKDRLNHSPNRTYMPVLSIHTTQELHVRTIQSIEMCYCTAEPGYMNTSMSNNFYTWQCIKC